MTVGFIFGSDNESRSKIKKGSKRREELQANEETDWLQLGHRTVAVYTAV